MAEIKRHASARWSGSGKDGNGEMTTQSGTLKGTPYGFNARSATAKVPIPRN